MPELATVKSAVARKCARKSDGIAPRSGVERDRTVGSRQLHVQRRRPIYFSPDRPATQVDGITGTVVDDAAPANIDASAAERVNAQAASPLRVGILILLTFVMTPPIWFTTPVVPLSLPQADRQYVAAHVQQAAVHVVFRPRGAVAGRAEEQTKVATGHCSD